MTALYACPGFRNKTHKQPVARVYDQYLYPEDIQDIFASGMNQHDSVVILRSYIDKWIKKQLILQKAELNLTDEQKDVSKQLEEYRSSLLIYKYEKNLIDQKLDTIVTSEEIEDYYLENQSNFLLNVPVIKGLFVQLPLDAPNTGEISRLYKSDKKEDLQQLESYCYQFAMKYDHFDDGWIPFERMLNQVPHPIDDPERFLQYNKFLETRDSVALYYVYIREFKLPGEVAPIEYVGSDIRNIILNKRKIKFVQQMENDIFNDGLSKGHFTIYADSP